MKTEDIALRFLSRHEGEGWSYDEMQCFLCLDPLTKETRTREHVFPKWLLKRHDMYNESMTLMNGTTIPYRTLTISCCKPCNGHFLSHIEDQVAQAFNGGYEAVTQLDRKLLFVWLAKLFYGLLVKERHSLLDRSDSNGNSILGDEDLQRFATHHLLMQHARGNLEWHSEENGDPFSMFILKCQESKEDVKLNFDYIDSFHIPFLAIRSGDVAIIASLQDWGQLARIETNHMEAAQQIALHPLQFTELAIVSNYTSIAFFQQRKLTIITGNGSATVIALPAPVNQRPNIENPQIIHIAPSLAQHWQVPLSSITDGNRVMTTLVQPDGSPFRIEWDGTATLPDLVM